MSYYYSQIGYGGICQRDIIELGNALRKQIKGLENQIDEKYVMNVIRYLRKYGLIKYHHKVRDTGQIEVELTQEAIILGRKYSSKIGTIGVLFTEYLWFWVVLSVLIGAIGVLTTILVAILKD